MRGTHKQETRGCQHPTHGTRRRAEGRAAQPPEATQGGHLKWRRAAGQPALQARPRRQPALTSRAWEQQGTASATRASGTCSCTKHAKGMREQLRRAMASSKVLPTRGGSATPHEGRPGRCPPVPAARAGRPGQRLPAPLPSRSRVWALRTPYRR